MPVDRARLLASHGAEAVALRWFGGPGQPTTPSEVELELFVHVLDALAVHVDRLGVVGASFGAEAALSVAARHQAIDAVIAFAPTAFVWPDRDPSGHEVSHWRWNGRPLPFVPLAADWEPDLDPPAFVSWYEQSVSSAPEAARIRAEDVAGRVVLVAGGDDQVWPSARWAQEIEDRRAAYRKATTVITQSDAGHRTTLPGEPKGTGGTFMRRGGNSEADAGLGVACWSPLIEALELRAQ